uniref:Synaptic vesicle glycoprotein 2B n=1 Tax=Hirondellea gigas TaxID=1518452 RepID=A0A6A7G016_9CRUS
MVVLMGGLANASDAMELLCLSILLPAAQCDLSMSSEEKGWLNAMVFFGMMVGGYVWGTLGDVYGRRRMLIFSLLVNAVAGLLSSLMQEYTGFLVMRFISGLGVGGSIPLVWAYVSEFQPPQYRGRALSIVASFWMVGNVLVAAVALAVIPLQMDSVSSSGFSFSSWRLFLIICALPSLCSGICMMWMPESPMFLLLQNREAEALGVLQRIFAANTGRLAKDYPIHNLRHLEGSKEHSSSSEGGARSSNVLVRAWASVASATSQAISKSRALFTPSIARATCVLLFINFAIAFGYYGLWLWFPELFNRLEHYYSDHPDSTASMCDVVEFKGNSSSESSPCDNKDGPVDIDALVNTLIVSIAPLPANLWTIVHMDKLGRKFFLVLSMLLSGTSVFGIYFVKSSLSNLLLSCMFGAVSTMGFNALDCLGTELFPTRLRSTALAVTLLSARVGAICGNIVFGYFVDTVCVLPMLIVAVLLISGGLSALFLPNTSRVALS